MNSWSKKFKLFNLNDLSWTKAKLKPDEWPGCTVSAPEAFCSVTQIEHNRDMHMCIAPLNVIQQSHPKVRFSCPGEIFYLLTSWTISHVCWIAGINIILFPFIFQIFSILFLQNPGGHQLQKRILHFQLWDKLEYFSIGCTVKHELSMPSITFTTITYLI